jgi:hypothetical protein
MLTGGFMSRNLLENLKSFNSKERFFIVGYALGNPDFKPCKSFCAEVGKKLRLSMPKNVFCAMDYHLDWLYASLQITEAKSIEGIYPNKGKIIRAQQEDVDFLMAYEEDGIAHIIIIEAKGFTGWTNSQLQSKAERLRDIFGKNGRNWKGVIPHFAIISPKEPKRIDCAHWPAWMAPQRNIAWIPLFLENKLRVSRCNINGTLSKNGKFWKVLER